MWIDTGESADTEDWFSELLAERKKQLAREEAEIILRDKDKLELLESLYVFQNGDDFKFPIRTNKQVRELINLERRTELTEELATEVFYLLSTDDSEIVNWAFDGVPWKPPTIDEIIEGNVAPTELGYKVLGKLLRTIQDYLPLEEEKSILNWLLFGKKPLVIEATDLQKSEILRVADNHKQILDSRYDFYRRNITPQHFVKMWFQKVLLCDVKTWTPSKESRAQSKAKIATFYMDKGWLPKKKNYPVAAYDKEIRKSIKDKLKDELPLQDEEITYLEEYGEILTIYPPTRYNRQRYDVLHGRYTSLIEREIHTVVRPIGFESADLL